MSLMKSIKGDLAFFYKWFSCKESETFPFFVRDIRQTGTCRSGWESILSFYFVIFSFCYQEDGGILGRKHECAHYCMQVPEHVGLNRVLVVGFTRQSQAKFCFHLREWKKKTNHLPWLSCGLLRIDSSATRMMSIHAWGQVDSGNLLIFISFDIFWLFLEDVTEGFACTKISSI